MRKHFSIFLSFLSCVFNIVVFVSFVAGIFEFCASFWMCVHARVRGGQACLAVMAASGGLAGLSRKHGVMVGSGSALSVEDVALAVGVLIGHSPVKSAAHMNKVVVLFLERVEQVDRLVEAGISVNRLFVQVTPLMHFVQCVLSKNYAETRQNNVTYKKDPVRLQVPAARACVFPSSAALHGPKQLAGGI